MGKRKTFRAGFAPQRRGAVKVFKNALCLAPIPDSSGYVYPPYALLCHRRRRHPLKHRVVFRDGGIREWNYGDSESVLARLLTERGR
jgi:hypothetical protein